MGVNTEITRQLDKNYVQVDVSSKKSPTRYFKVPAQNADKFASQYKKQDKKISIFTNTLFGGSLIAGVIIAYKLTEKIKNGALRFAIGTAGGIAGATASLFASTKYIESRQDKLLKNFGAKEIFYKD